MPPPLSDVDLLARQDALWAEAAELLADRALAAVLADAGPVHLTGSYVSGLMCWPDLDVMVHVGAAFTPGDVLRMLERIVDLPGVVAFEYRDERGPRSPTGTARDERYHVPVTVSRHDRMWRLDLTLWLNDPHENLTAWHENLRATITPEQRQAILRIKDVWHRLPTYPDEIGGTDIYTAVLDGGIRSPEEFVQWLGQRTGPSRDQLRSSDQRDAGST